MNSRSAVAFGSPQDVEVLVDGVWVPGGMLGWRHDETGDCEAWVQLRTDAPGSVEGAGAWVSLTDVRLPERHLSLAAAPATAALPAVGGPAAPAGRPRRPRRHGADVTAEQPAVGVGAAGRHRAPAESAGLTDPAEPAGSVAVTGAGRHRAVTAELPAVAASAATVLAPAIGTPAVAAPVTGGPADAGAPSGAAAAVPVPAPADHDGLTRPIRLGDLVPGARAGRPPVRPTA